MYEPDLIRYLQFRIPRGARVLDVGCASRARLESIGGPGSVGVCTESSDTDIAQTDGLRFIKSLDELTPDDSFDYVLLADVLANTADVQVYMENLHPWLHPRSRLIVIEYSRVWEPLVRLRSSFAKQPPTKTRNWLSPWDLCNICTLADYDVVSAERRVLLPLAIPIIARTLNRIIARLPLLEHLTLYNVLTFRPNRESPPPAPGISVVIPARNEAGNIEDAIRRLPKLGRKTQVIFVEGGSSDNTWEEIQRVITEYSDEWSILAVQQTGTGKGDAVRKGFSLATEDIVTILDADLTMPPEDLPRYYHALVSGKAEFVNGCRLIYPLEKESMRFLNMIGNHFFSHLFSWLLGRRIKDTLCGTKMLYRRDYELLAANRDYFGDFDPFGDFDLIFGAARLNLKIVDMPIRYRARQYGETNISRWRHGLLLLRMSFFAMWKIKFI